MIAPSNDHAPPELPAGSAFYVRVLRQDGPGRPERWERFQLAYEPGMNVISVLQQIAAQPVTSEGTTTTPVAWDCNCLEEVCGACTMVINDRVRQSCSANVARLLADNPGEIELRPMEKFPVVRDLVVDRSRLFRALTKIKAWVPVEGYYEMGPGPKIAREMQERMYPLSECMSCGCCLDACPQYAKIELEREPGESDADFERRKNETYDVAFVGPHAIAQTELHNSHPTGAMMKSERIDIMMQPGGIQDCGNAQNCVAVCPKHIPLTTSIGRIGRAATVRAFTRIFGS